MDAATEFWTSGHRYEELVIEYEQHIEITHPEIVTSRGMCRCLDFAPWCDLAPTAVKYYEHRGPSV